MSADNEIINIYFLPDYSELLDDDIKNIFGYNKATKKLQVGNYMSFEPLLAQLIKELTKRD